MWSGPRPDFCSALHQEMQGYVRVSPSGSTVPLVANVSAKAQTQVARAQKYVNPNAAPAASAHAGHAAKPAAGSPK